MRPSVYRQVSRCAPFVVLCSLSISVLAQPTPTPPRPVPEDAMRLQIDPLSGNVNLRARDVPISFILNRLEQQGVQVVVPDLQDRTVTVSVNNRPLREVITAILPAGTRFWIRGEKGDVVIPGKTTDKRGRRTQRAPGMPTKGGMATLSPINAQAGRKPLPEAPSSSPKLVPGMKAAPTVRDLPEGRGPKIARRVETPGRYVRLRLTMTTSAVSVDHAVVLESELIPDQALLGEYVWALESAGRVFAVGSFRDPLEQHSFFADPTREHGVIGTKSGEFLVSLPGTVLDRGVLAGTRLIIYRLTDSPPTTELTPETFPKFRGVLREMYVVTGQELVRRLELQ